MSDRLTVTTTNDAVLRGLARFEKQLTFASMRALNNTAFAARKAARDQIAQSLDRPTPKTVALPTVTKRATRDSLVAELALDYRRFTGTTGYLTPQIEGGKRVTKAFERRLIEADVMPRGMYAVYAKRSGYLDRFGNLPGAKIRQILSWFQAFKEAGHNQNMKERAKNNLRQGKRKGMKWGIAYFVSRGERSGGLGMRLPPGVWERNYPHGQAGKSFIKPVLLFVQDVSYRPRLDYVGAVQRAVEQTLERQLEAELARALRTAR